MGFHLPFFPMYAAETLADGRFQQWSLEERGAWVTLLLHNWNDGDVPASQTALARLLSCDTGDMARIWSAIGDRFIEVPDKPGRLFSPRLEGERDKALALSRKRGEARKEGAKARWGKGKARNGKRIPLPLRPQCDGSATAMRSECPQQPQPQPPSQSPSPARYARSAGARVEMGMEGARVVAGVASGLGHALYPLKAQDEADEFERRIEREGGADRVIAYIAATCRARSIEPEGVKILLLMLRDLAPDPPSEASA